MNERPRGTFIVFEGVDGSGKSTQVARLVRWLESLGNTVVATREPYDCAAGRRIRAMASGEERVSAEQELVWFEEQRREHVREVIEPALAAGHIVVCDRYYLSSVAYQGARGLSAALILRESEAAFPQPDLVLLLDLEPEEGLDRVAVRGGTVEPVFEEPERLEAVASIYRSLDLPYLERVHARGSEDAVAARLQGIVRERIAQVR